MIKTVTLQLPREQIIRISKVLVITSPISLLQFSTAKKMLPILMAISEQTQKEVQSLTSTDYSLEQDII
jgi:hypothetical protein